MSLERDLANSRNEELITQSTRIVILWRIVNFERALLCLMCQEGLRLSTVEEALLAGPARGPGKSSIRHAMQRDGRFRLHGYVFDVLGARGYSSRTLVEPHMTAIASEALQSLRAFLAMETHSFYPEKYTIVSNMYINVLTLSKFSVIREKNTVSRTVLRGEYFV